MKYIKKYSSISAATSDNSLYSPATAVVLDASNNQKVLTLNCGSDKKVQISGTSLDDLGIEEKK